MQCSNLTMLFITSLAI